MRCRVFSIAAALALAGCAHEQAGVRVQTVEVVKEVQVPCPVEVPARPAPIGALPSDARDALRIVGAKLLEYAGPGAYADRADAALRICTAERLPD
ncbi:hypothetical protein [Sphingopyxis indica]|uniref:Lipoprotein n=1 Tax=Sphingopyxis indica TaxID=436663 RepID=A0A239KLG1_9SPHN|nr:hypothetical protein [Sphingopyxis indica]SNT19196.1 hypothetical protein SAMN06295955_11539 [Sphingopyxis indica]